MAFYANLTPEMEKKLVDTINEMFPAQIAALQEQVRIPSVKLPPDGPGRPFGAPIQASLTHALALCKSLGLTTRDLDGYVGVAEYGDQAETLGILAHLDVVPAGDGWSVEPFGADIKEGVLYGRGVTDDKGPALSALFAFAAILRCNIPLKRKVQFILGCDEESGWECMNHFKKKEPLPTLAFSPDGEYPLVYSERAIIQADYHAPAPETCLQIVCGERANVVPGKALAVLPAGTQPPRVTPPEGFRVEASVEEDGLHIAVTGLGAHASTPESGKNALQYLLAILNTMPLPAHDALIVRTLYHAFGMDVHAQTLELDTEDESGRLTLNLGMLHWGEDGVTLTLDARCPRSLSPERLLNTISQALNPAGFTLREPHIKAGHHIDQGSELVQKLMGVYRAQTGDMESNPLAIGGGTYARAMPVAVAFGCEYPGQPMVAHMPDERVNISAILQNTLIMADAILALAM